MRTKNDKMLCEAYLKMVNNKQTVRTISESEDNLSKQSARTDKTYSNIMESYNNLINKTRLDEATYFDFVKKFIKDKEWKYINKSGDEIDMPGIIAQKDASKKKAIADAWAKQKSSVKEAKTLEENNIMERASQIKSKNDKMSWVEAKKRAQAELDDNEEIETIETEDKPLEEGKDTIDPPKNLVNKVDKSKKVKLEDDEEEEEEEEEEEITEDDGIIDKTKKLKADIEKLKKREKLSFKEMAKRFLKEDSDEDDEEDEEEKAKGVLITINKKVKLPSGYGSKSTSLYWPVSVIVDMFVPTKDYKGKNLGINVMPEDKKTTNDSYKFTLSKLDKTNEEIFDKLSSLYFEYLTTKRIKSDSIFGSTTPDPVDALTSKNAKDKVLRKIITIKR